MDSKRNVRIYADGVYDLFHYGHARQLEQCKKLKENVTLVVGVCGQEEVVAYKGPTVMDGYQRTEGVKHCKWADEVIYPAPWYPDMAFMKKHKIDYVAHDDIPYVTAGCADVYADFKKAGMFLATQRTEGISTSDIIGKILQDRDDYLMRNLQRGYTRQQLGVGVIEYASLKVKGLLKRLCCQKKKKVE